MPVAMLPDQPEAEDGGYAAEVVPHIGNGCQWGAEPFEYRSGHYKWHGEPVERIARIVGE